MRPADVEPFYFHWTGGTANRISIRISGCDRRELRSVNSADLIGYLIGVLPYPFQTHSMACGMNCALALRMP